MRRKLCAVLISVLCAGSLAGCAGMSAEEMKNAGNRLIAEGQNVNRRLFQEAREMNSRKAVAVSGAHSTDLQNPEAVHELCYKCKHTAENWTPVADALWGCSGTCVECVEERKCVS